MYLQTSKSQLVLVISSIPEYLGQRGSRDSLKGKGACKVHETSTKSQSTETANSPRSSPFGAERDARDAPLEVVKK